MFFPEIEILGQTLSLGETLREICPSCHDSKKTFSLTRKEDGGLVWQCFRAKCGIAGGNNSTSQGTKLPPVRKPKMWEGKTHELPIKVQAWITREWGITSPEYWWYTKDYGGRIAMSIRSPKYTHRGWVLRSDGVGVKALTYLNSGEQALSWYQLKKSPSCTVVVEDIPSAIRASAYVSAVALLGTHIGDDKALEIAKYAARPIYIALDQDATELSFKWASRYSLLWDDVRILPLKHDIKNMQEKDLCNLLTEKERS